MDHCIRSDPNPRRCTLRVWTLLAWITAVLMSLPSQAASLDGLAVEVVNESEPVLCAEKDNVAIALSSDDVRSFRIEAAHPVYFSTQMRDRQEPDWTACDMAADPAYRTPAPPRKFTIHEDRSVRLVGLVYPSFWRKGTALVRVGARIERDIHLVQLWLARGNGWEEVLVLYPQDGYWRARPMSPGPSFTPYGSSFLFGPIQRESRPFVGIRQVAFDPPARRFTLEYENGQSGELALVDVDQSRIALDVRFDKPVVDAPFAMLRSMYITEFNNDAARIALRERGASGWREENLMKFDRAMATDLWVGRLSPSQHNTSAPDHVFNSFSATQTPRRPRREQPAP